MSTESTPPPAHAASDEHAEAVAQAEKKLDYNAAVMAHLDDESAGEFSEYKDVRKGLHQRHIQMIALAGTIGTGLFLGSGRALSRAGPLGAFLGYSIIGATVSSVVLAVGEMGALVPLNGGVVRYAEYFVDPALSFADGWNLVYSYMVSIPAEIVAAAVLIEFWATINNAIWITLFGALMLGTALVFVRVYGELEFGFSMLKIALIIGINIMVCIAESLYMRPLADLIGTRYHLRRWPVWRIHRLQILEKSRSFCAVSRYPWTAWTFLGCVDYLEQCPLRLQWYREHHSRCF